MRAKSKPGIIDIGDKPTPNLGQKPPCLRGWKRGGHDIPCDDVIRRFAGRWEAVAKVLPYCDEAEFYDNDNGFTLVAEYRNGELRTVGSRVPRWLEELQEYLNR